MAALPTELTVTIWARLSSGRLEVDAHSTLAQTIADALVEHLQSGRKGTAWCKDAVVHVTTADKPVPRIPSKAALGEGREGWASVDVADSFDDDDEPDSVHELEEEAS